MQHTPRPSLPKNFASPSTSTHIWACSASCHDASCKNNHGYEMLWLGVLCIMQSQ
jgi:hypothetical protein